MLQLLYDNFTSFFFVDLTSGAVEGGKDDALGAAILHQSILGAIESMLSEELVFSVSSYDDSSLIIISSGFSLLMCLVAISLVSCHILVREVLSDGLSFLICENLHLESLFICFLKPSMLFDLLHCDSL